MPVIQYEDELTEKRQQVQDAIDAFIQDPEFDPDSPELRELHDKAERIEKQQHAVEQARERRQAADSLMRRMGRVPAVADTGSDLDVGSQLVASHAFQMWKRQGASGRAKLLDVNMRALMTTTTVPGTNDRRYQNDPSAVPTPLLNVLSRVQVSSNAVDVVTYGSPPAAAVVAEGAQKPEAALSIDVDTYTLQTLAHWVEATRQVVDDETRLRDFISNSLLRGVYRKAETDAAGVITGGTYTGASGGSMMEAIRVGIATVQTQGFQPNAVVLNALDAASLDFFVWDNSGGGQGAGSSVWGLRVVPSPDVPAGSAFVGDFATGFEHYYRGAAELFVTDSDVGIVAAAPVSNFKRNVLTFLAEMRAVTVLVQPSAIVECTTTGGALTRTTKPAPEPAKSKG